MIPPVECWAVCQFYEPFVMGGEVWQRRRFKVQGYEREFTSRGYTYTMFCYLRDEHWQIHEKSTGAHVTSVPRDTSIYNAVKAVQNLLDSTPDFHHQVEETMGKWEDAREVSTPEAFRRLKKEAKT